MPWQIWAICTIARSGSSWLCDLVASTGLLGYPEEYFLEWRKLAVANGLSATTTFEEYVQFLLDQRSTPNGVFAVKGSVDELEPFLALFPEAPCVWLTREDKVAQAVSWHRAHDGGLWVRTAAGPTVPHSMELSFERVREFHEEIQRRETAWREFFRKRRNQPLYLTYEQTCAEPLAAVRAIAHHVGVPPAAIRDVGSPLRIVRDERSEAWVARVRERFN